MADKEGNVICLGEQECSIQRKNQKLLEESPSPALSEATRQRMQETAVQAAKAVHYENAGTLEFLVTAQGDFYFMEMNTRLQVEHTVTEMVTGIDLVKWQIRIAAGIPLSITQEEAGWRAAPSSAALMPRTVRRRFVPVPDGLPRCTFRAVHGCGLIQPFIRIIRYRPFMIR